MTERDPVRFSSAQVRELLEAADTAAFLSRHQHAIVISIESGGPRPKDAEMMEAVELLARWEGSLPRVLGDPDDQAAWDELFLIAGALLALMRRTTGG